MKDKLKKRLNSIDSSIIEESSTANKFNYSLTELLLNRGIEASKLNKFLNYSDNNFYDPFLMNDMKEATELIMQTISNEGAILIYGDYDADGLTASSNLKLFLDTLEADSQIFIPERKDGYGLNSASLLNLFEEKNFDLVITVDCGISNADEVNFIIETFGAEVIVTDHHEIPQVLPDCLCVNPKLGYPFAQLSGAGVVFKLIQALSNLDTAKNFSCLAAVGTIGDVMPLIDENRDIVKIGLENYNHSSLKKLAELSNIKNINAVDIAMKICPKLNAAGRIAQPIAALNILLQDKRANLIEINQLISINTERQNLLEKMSSEVLDKIKEKSSAKVIIAYSPNWLSGLIGVCASRVKELYNRPCFILTADGDNIIGSCRSIDEIDIVEILNNIKDTLIKFGGHKAAAGFSIKKENLDIFVERLLYEINKIDDSKFVLFQSYDLEFDAECQTESFLNDLQRLEPYSPQEKVVFHVKDGVEFVSLFGSEQSHIKLVLNNNLELKGFNLGQYFNALKTNPLVEVLFTLEYDNYQKKTVGLIKQLYLSDSIRYDDIYATNIIKRISYDKSHKQITETGLFDIVKKENNLIIFNSFLEYNEYRYKDIFDNYYLDYFYPFSSANTVLISPQNDVDMQNYTNIVVMNSYDGFKIDVNNDKVLYLDAISLKPSYLVGLNITRELCLEVFLTIKKGNVKLDNISFTTSLMDITNGQYLMCIKILAELNLIRVNADNKLETIVADRTNLNLSPLYNYLAKI